MKKIITNTILIIIFIILMFFVVTYFSKDNEENIEGNKINQNLEINNVNEEEIVENNNLNEENNMKIETLQEGEGVDSKEGDVLVVHYTGTFENGDKFDSSLDRGEPFSFTLGSGMVIEGWEKGMLGMKKGEKRKLFIPYNLAYGENDYSSIPGKSNLIFEVELLDIK